MSGWVQCLPVKLLRCFWHERTVFYWRFMGGLDRNSCYCKHREKNMRRMGLHRGSELGRDRRRQGRREFRSPDHDRTTRACRHGTSIIPTGQQPKSGCRSFPKLRATLIIPLDSLRDGSCVGKPEVILKWSLRNSVTRPNLGTIRGR